MNQFYLPLIASFLVSATMVKADNVILMIGDGMGMNHIQCATQGNDLFLKTMQPQTWIKTASANNLITDSAAAATAYACGIKTNNGRIGMTAEKHPCQTIAEEALQKDKKVYLISSDKPDGATPAAFYAHVPKRAQSDDILTAYQTARTTFYTDFDTNSVSKSVDKIIPELKNNEQEYFVMIEGAKIDKASHNKNLKRMIHEMRDFDKAVQTVWDFAKTQPNVHVFVVADHETGGLTTDCQYTTGGHTPTDVPFYAYTNKQIPSVKIQNTDVYQIMRTALFSE